MQLPSRYVPMYVHESKRCRHRHTSCDVSITHYYMVGGNPPPDTTGSCLYRRERPSTLTQSLPDNERRPCKSLETPKTCPSDSTRLSTPLVALHNLGDGVTDSDSCFLRLLLGQTGRYADFDGRRWLPTFVSWVGSQPKRVRLQPGDKNTISEALGLVSNASKGKKFWQTSSTASCSKCFWS